MKKKRRQNNITKKKKINKQHQTSLFITFGEFELLLNNIQIPPKHYYNLYYRDVLALCLLYMINIKVVHLPLVTYRDLSLFLNYEIPLTLSLPEKITANGLEKSEIIIYKYNHICKKCITKFNLLQIFNNLCQISRENSPQNSELSPFNLDSSSLTNRINSKLFATTIKLLGRKLTTRTLKSGFYERLLQDEC